jgi:integrase
VVQYEIQPLTEADARCFLETLKGHRLEPLYRVALWLGMRKGELLSLCWSDVNMKTGVISVETSKTEAGVRTLAVPAPLLDILNAHQERQQEERRMQGVQWQEHGLVFPSEVGTRMLPGNLHRHFKATLEKAGLRNSIRFHDLRHTCASFLVAQGAHPRTIMNILGHSKVHTTMEIYAHTLDNTQRSALESLDTMFR